MSTSSDFDSYTLLPGYSDIDGKAHVDLSTRITTKHRIGIPLVASPMSTVTEHRMAVEMARLGGVGVIHRYMSLEEQANEIKKFRDTTDEKSFVGAAIGVTDGVKRIDYLEHTAPPDFYMFDIANGDLAECYAITKGARAKDISLISGNIVTADAAKRYYDAGISGFRVGVGSGSVCITRRVTGFGRNQLRAVNEIHRAIPDIPITSCGGIRDGGDIVKALAFGAESVIIGRLFATCDESAAPKFPDSRIAYGGMASYFSENMRAARTGEDINSIHHAIAPEGIHEILESTGPLEKTVTRLVGSIKTGLSYYAGSRSIEEFHKSVVWEEA